MNVEAHEDDFNDFIVDYDYVKYQSKQQKLQGIIDYESDEQEDIINSSQEKAKDLKIVE